MSAVNALVATGFEVTQFLLGLYFNIILVGVIMSWLVAAGVINMHNRIVQSISDIIFRVTEPALKPIRRMLPATGGLDFAPFVLMLIIYVLQILLRNLALQYAISANH